MRILLVLTWLFLEVSCPAAEPVAGPVTDNKAGATNSAGTKYFVQLVRGSENDKPPQAGARQVGEKLKKELQPIFRWKHYWEVQRTDVTVPEGKSGRTELQEGHSLEIDHQQADKRTVRLFKGKKLVRTSVASKQQKFCIQGIESGDGTVWFIIVRPDPPSSI